MRTEALLLAFLVLCGGRGFTSAETFVYKEVEGGHFREKFVFHKSGTQKLFCKNDCEKKENILVQTFDTREQNGRYSIEFEQNSNPYILHVGINNLSISDSGSYTCEVWSGRVLMDSTEFQLNVSRAARSSEPHVSTTPSVTFSVEHHVTPVASTLTPPELLPSASVKPVTSTVTPPELLPSGPGRLLWLLLIPVAVVMTSVPLLLICRKKKTQNDQEPRRSRTETEEYENMKAVSESADCTYQSLRVDTMDPNQVYSTV